MSEARRPQLGGGQRARAAGAAQSRTDPCTILADVAAAAHTRSSSGNAQKKGFENCSAISRTRFFTNNLKKNRRSCKTKQRSLIRCAQSLAAACCQALGFGALQAFWPLCRSASASRRTSRWCDPPRSVSVSCSSHACPKAYSALAGTLADLLTGFNNCTAQREALEQCTARLEAAKKASRDG